MSFSPSLTAQSPGCATHHLLASLAALVPVHAHRRDGARRNSDAVPRRLDGVEAQPRHPLSTASATNSLGELHLPPVPLLRDMVMAILMWCSSG